MKIVELLEFNVSLPMICGNPFQRTDCWNLKGMLYLNLVSIEQHVDVFVFERVSAGFAVGAAVCVKKGIINSKTFEFSMGLYILNDCNVF